MLEARSMNQLKLISLSVPPHAVPDSVPVFGLNADLAKSNASNLWDNNDDMYDGYPTEQQSIR